MAAADNLKCVLSFLTRGQTGPRLDLLHMPLQPVQWQSLMPGVE